MFKVGTFLNTLAFPYNLFNVEILGLQTSYASVGRNLNAYLKRRHC